MRDVILNFPRQFRQGIAASKKLKKSKKKYSNVIVCGMGGSGLPGSLLKNLVGLNVFNHKDYGLPKQANKNSLVICISYSGNTRETISSFQEAKKKKLQLMTISSGGKLTGLSKKFKVPFVNVLSGIQPRAALGYQFGALVGVLSKTGLVKGKFAREVANLKLNAKASEHKGKELAKALKGKILLLYTSNKFKEVAYVWKISFNETSKNLAYCNLFPELCHNEIEMLEKVKAFRKKIAIIMLQDKKDNPAILKQMAIIKSFYKKKRLPVETVGIKGRNLLEKTFSTIILGMWTAYYLALQNKVNPGPVRIIEDLKKMLD